MIEWINTPAGVSVVTGLTAGIGLKVVDWLLSRSTSKANEQAVMRDELRKEIDYLRGRLTDAQVEEIRLEALIDDWRAKYYSIMEDKQRLMTELQIALNQVEILKNAIPKEDEG